jgi:hypothetical protein
VKVRQGEGGETGRREKRKDRRRREKVKDNKNLEPLALISNKKNFPPKVDSV